MCTKSSLLSVVVLIVLLLGGGTGIVAQETTSDVPMLGGNAARTGEMPGPAPTGVLAPVWQFDTEGSDSDSTPAVIEDMLYVGTGQDYGEGGVLALEAMTGVERWRFPTNGKVDSSPAVVDGVVFVGTSDGYVYAIDAQSGEYRWEFLAGSSVRTSPAVVDGKVFVGDYDGDLHVLDVASGSELWRFVTEDRFLASPAVSDGRVYVTMYSGTVYAMDATTGEEVWNYVPEGCCGADYGLSTPVVADGSVYLRGEYGLYRLDAATGAEQDVFAPGIYPEDCGTGNFVVSDGTLYANQPVDWSDDGSRICAIDIATGSVKWSVYLETGGGVRFVIGDQVFVESSTTDSTLLAALDANTGESVWQSEINILTNSNLVVVGGVIYFNHGDIYAIAGGADPTTLPIEEGATVLVLDEGADVRAAPSTSAVVIESLAAETELVVTGPSEELDGTIWWPVQNQATGSSGWVEDESLVIKT